MLIERAIRAFICQALLALSALLIACGSAQAQDQLEWTTIRPGLRIAKYLLSPAGSMMKSEVVLLEIDLDAFSLQLSLASDAGAVKSDIKTLTRRAGGAAGINANFFGENDLPLGLVLRGADTIQRLQSGGNLLTGVFYIVDGKPAIVHRKDFSPAPNISLAFQAGPRLIANREPVQVAALQGSSRRSGIAVNEDGRVLLYATLVRFPGASLEQIQAMLLDPQLKIKDALNLDGGGSSQLYVEAGGGLKDEIEISGGDLIPVSLIAKPRTVKSAAKQKK